MALYGVSLLLEQCSFHPKLATRSEGNEWCAGGIEREMIDKLVEELANVDIVACQKLVHPRVKCLLLSKGVLVLERLSVENIEAVKLISGAQVCSVFSAPKEDELGVVDAVIVSPIILGRYHVILRNDAIDITTLLIAAVDNDACVELKHGVECALKGLRHVINDAVVVPGAGHCEVYIASELRRRLGEESIGVKAMVRSFASALEYTAGALDKSRRVTSSEVIGKISEGIARSLGWDPTRSTMMTTPVYQGRAAKVSALKTAVEGALLISRIGGVIVDT